MKRYADPSILWAVQMAQTYGGLDLSQESVRTMLEPYKQQPNLYHSIKASFFIAMAPRWFLAGVIFGYLILVGYIHSGL